MSQRLIKSTMQRRSFSGSLKAFGDSLGPRQFAGVASSGAVDRMGDIVVPAGGDVTQFRKNPILQSQHDANYPIGTVPWIALQGGEWKFLAEFAPEGVSSKADEVCRLVKAGILSAVSIGFLPRAWSYLDGGGVRFTEWELLELSVVSVPAAPGALISERALGGSGNRSDDLARARLIVARARARANDEATDRARARAIQVRHGRNAAPDINAAYAEQEEQRRRERAAGAARVAAALAWW